MKYFKYKCIIKEKDCPRKDNYTTILDCVSNCLYYKGCQSCEYGSLKKYCNNCLFSKENEKEGYLNLIIEMFCKICDDWQSEGYGRINCSICPYKEILKKILKIDQE